MENFQNMPKSMKWTHFGAGDDDEIVFDDIGEDDEDIDDILLYRFVQLCSELMDTLEVIRKPNNMCFVSNSCVVCGGVCVYNMEAA